MAAVSRAKRASNNKWDRENMKIISCKIKIEEAEAFERYAQERGTTRNALISGYIRRCLAADQAEKQQQSGTD